MDDFKEKDKRLYYEDLAKQVEREDSLVNTRMTWMLTLQGFLFTALALISKKADIGNELYRPLTIIFPITGIVLSVFGFIGSCAANLALGDLRKLWDKFEEKEVYQTFWR